MATFRLPRPLGISQVRGLHLDGEPDLRVFTARYHFATLHLWGVFRDDGLRAESYCRLTRTSARRRKEIGNARERVIGRTVKDAVELVDDDGATEALKNRAEFLLARLQTLTGVCVPERGRKS